MSVRCQFMVRTPTEGGYHYDYVHINSPSYDGRIDLPEAPVVGDMISLPGHPCAIVLSRDWSFSRWGSTNWPYGEPESTVPPDVTLIVEDADGGFMVDQVVRPEDEDSDEVDG